MHHLAALIVKIVQWFFGPSQILVYEDQDVQGAEECAVQLREIFGPNICIKKVDSHYLKSTAWEKHTIALVMGGGKCSQWDANLGDEGIQKIRNYVRGGGKYIGICAGAYYACAESRFANLAPKQRALSFFSGRAIGPLTNSCVAEVAFKLNGIWTNGSLYYQGGCYFETRENDPNTEVLAYYRDFEKAAAVRCKVEKGEAFLIGLHPEYVWDKLNCIMDERILLIAEALHPHEFFRKQVWREIRL